MIGWVFIKFVGYYWYIFVLRNIYVVIYNVYVQGI